MSMLTFKQFLNERKHEGEDVSRITPTDVDHAVRWMANYSEDYLKGKDFLLRGGGHQRGVLYGDSSKSSPRKSANTYNNYTLWMDNHPDFHGTPKRSQSFVCTSEHSTAEAYGATYIVVPHDNVKVGIVGKLDLWQTPILDWEGEGIWLHDFNEYTEHVLVFCGMGDADTYEALTDMLKKCTIKLIEEKFKEKETVRDLNKSYAIKMRDFMDEYNCSNLFDLWDKLISPTLFKYTTGAKASKGLHGEIWFEGPAMFIPTYQGGISQQDQAELMYWAEEEAPTLHRFIKKFWTEDFESADDDESIGVDPDSVSDEDSLTYQQRRKRG